MIPSCLRPAVKSLYSLLYSIVVIVWIVDLCTYKINWECYICREGQDPSIAPFFIYFSMWNVWLSCAVFVTWAYFADQSDMNGSIKSDNKRESQAATVARRLFTLSLPYATTVSITYTIYIMGNSTADVVNQDVCYAAIISGVSKDVEETLASLYLLGAVVADLTIHYFGTLLMMWLYFAGEIPYITAIPWSTLFVVVVGIVIGMVQSSGTSVYCGDNIWFNVAVVWLFDMLLHFAFYFGARGKCCCQTWSCVQNADRGSNASETSDEMVCAVEPVMVQSLASGKTCKCNHCKLKPNPQHQRRLHQQDQC